MWSLASDSHCMELTPCEGASMAPSHASPRKHQGCAGEAGARTEARQHVRSDQSNHAAGYEPRILKNTVRLWISASASATAGVSRWPSTSMNMTYSHGRRFV